MQCPREARDIMVMARAVPGAAHGGLLLTAEVHYSLLACLFVCLVCESAAPRVLRLLHLRSACFSAV